MTRPKTTSAPKAPKRGPAKDKSFDLKTPTSRERITPWKNPYFLELEPGQHLGYRKGTTKSTWYARLESPRLSLVLGKADDGIGKDHLTADGQRVLTYEQAKEAARKWFALITEKDGTTKSEPDQATLQENAKWVETDHTVGDALEDFLHVKEQRKAPSFDATQSRVKKTISEIGHIKLRDLTHSHLEEWVATLIKTPPQFRSKKGGERNFDPSFDPDNEDHVRQRMSTANRALRDVKAALNAKSKGKDKWIASKAAWVDVHEFPDTDGRREDVLSLDEQGLLLNACSPELRPLVYTALLTGQRYGPLRRLLVKDFDPLARAMCVERDKTGPLRFAPLTDQALVVFWSICEGRDPEEVLLLRANGKAWGKSTHSRKLKESREAANLEITLYGLRHTCITQWLMSGIPTAVVAEAVNTSVKMIDKHYKHLTPEGLAGTINAKAPKLGDHKESEAILAKIEAMRQEKKQRKLPLEFDLSSLHPSAYVGKIKGGREVPKAGPPRPTKEELEVLLKEMPTTQIAQKYGVSDKAIEKWARKWDLRKPGRGHWTKVRAKGMDGGGLSE